MVTWCRGFSQARYASGTFSRSSSSSVVPISKPPFGISTISGQMASAGQMSRNSLGGDDAATGAGCDRIVTKCVGAGLAGTLASGVGAGDGSFTGAGCDGGAMTGAGTGLAGTLASGVCTGDGSFTGAGCDGGAMTGAGAGLAGTLATGVDGGGMASRMLTYPISSTTIPTAPHSTGFFQVGTGSG